MATDLRGLTFQELFYKEQQEDVRCVFCNKREDNGIIYGKFHIYGKHKPTTTASSSLLVWSRRVMNMMMCLDSSMETSRKKSRGVWDSSAINVVQQEQQWTVATLNARRLTTFAVALSLVCLTSTVGPIIHSVSTTAPFRRFQSLFWRVFRSHAASAMKKWWPSLVMMFSGPPAAKKIGSIVNASKNWLSIILTHILNAQFALTKCFSPKKWRGWVSM